METRDKCRICRSAGEKLFLKGDKCNSPSCPVAKRNYAPGQGGAKKRIRRGSDYSLQLKEKQRARAIYGVSETQMSNYFKMARKNKSETGNKLVELLEGRLDNVVFRAGWTPSRRAARQIVSHGKVHIAGKNVKVPSYQVKTGEIVSTDVQAEKKAELPSWLKQIKSAGSVEIMRQATKDDVQDSYNEQLIIEYYSR